MENESCVTVKDMMDARENRAQEQRSLLACYGMPLISFGLNIPGPKKVNALYHKAFSHGVECIKMLLQQKEVDVIYEEIHENATGFEYIASVNAEAVALKKHMIRIEDEHILGRLFDIDVIAPGYQKISRGQLAIKERKCMLCENEAYVCARSRKHSVEELVAEINNMIESFLK